MNISIFLLHQGWWFPIISRSSPNLIPDFFIKSVNDQPPMNAQSYEDQWYPYDQDNYRCYNANVDQTNHGNDDLYGINYQPG